MVVCWIDDTQKNTQQRSTIASLDIDMEFTHHYGDDIVQKKTGSDLMGAAQLRLLEAEIESLRTQIQVLHGKLHPRPVPLAPASPAPTPIPISGPNPSHIPHESPLSPSIVKTVPSLAHSGSSPPVSSPLCPLTPPTPSTTRQTNKVQKEVHVLGSPASPARHPTYQTNLSGLQTHSESAHLEYLLLATESDKAVLQRKLDQATKRTNQLVEELRDLRVLLLTAHAPYLATGLLDDQTVIGWSTPASSQKNAAAIEHPSTPSAGGRPPRRVPRPSLGDARAEHLLLAGARFATYLRERRQQQANSRHEVNSPRTPQRHLANPPSFRLSSDRNASISPRRSRRHPPEVAQQHVDAKSGPMGFEHLLTAAQRVFDPAHDSPMIKAARRRERIGTSRSPAAGSPQTAKRPREEASIFTAGFQGTPPAPEAHNPALHFLADAAAASSPVSHPPSKPLIFRVQNGPKATSLQKPILLDSPLPPSADTQLRSIDDSVPSLRWDPDPITPATFQDKMDLKKARSPYHKWTAFEDDLLVKAVAMYSQKWDLVSKMVGTRSYHQCRQRFLRKHSKNEQNGLPNDSSNIDAGLFHPVADFEDDASSLDPEPEFEEED